MFFLFSGEGVTDFGTCCRPDVINKGEEFLHGPLVVAVDQIVEYKYSYSLLDSAVFAFVPRGMLDKHAKKELRPRSKSVKLTGHKTKKETMYFYRNAWALGHIAVQYGKDNGENEVIAILYRDGDKPSERGVWEDKRDSILRGFRDGGCFRGVPMIPKSISESWMLCAIYKKLNSGLSYDYLENEKYGSGARHQLKDKLDLKSAFAVKFFACRFHFCTSVSSYPPPASSIDQSPIVHST